MGDLPAEAAELVLELAREAAQLALGFFPNLAPNAAYGSLLVIVIPSVVVSVLLFTVAVHPGNGVQPAFTPHSHHYGGRRTAHEG